MNAYQVYEYYLAIKAHFTSDYDAFEHNFKVRANVASYEKRPDKYFFEKLAKFHDPKGFILSNLIQDPKNYIRELTQNEQSQLIYNKWRKTKDSLSYIFTNDLKKISANFNSSFICTPGNHPPLLRHYLLGEITLETLCILCAITKCLDYWDQRLEGDMIYDDLKNLIIKYTPFISFDKRQFKKIIKGELNV